jgi:hypothetical protein
MRVAPLAKILFNTIEKSVPDKDLQAKLKARSTNSIDYNLNTAELTAAARIVEAEAKAGWFAKFLETITYVRINFYINMELCIRTCYFIFF